MTWLKDSNGNKCSVEYFGSVEKAQEALDSLRNCSDCSNCTNCSSCSYCSDCSYCSYCSSCSYCSDCSNCSDCSDCSSCSYCSRTGWKKEFKPRETQELVSIPKIEKIHTKIFAAVSQPNALDMKSWHTCETTHCRAGWVVHLAGEAGKKLEKFHNTPLAASLIYRESSPYKVSGTQFYKNNDEAMEDMKRMMELENFVKYV